MRTTYIIAISLAVLLIVVALVDTGQGTTWGAVQRIEFSDEELPDNLYSMFTGKPANSALRYCLPADYSKDKSYPLIVYVPGYHGHPSGNIQNAKDIADGHECVVASLPLFKAGIDRSEIGHGLIVSFADYPVLSRAYAIMFEKLDRVVPNIDRERSAMVGFSNGAIATGVLVSSHDTNILERFASFCMVENGMFHLTDLHQSGARDRRYLILVGDELDYGRELKLRGAQLAEDSWQTLGVDIESRILQDTGHELTEACKQDIGRWVFE